MPIQPQSANCPYCGARLTIQPGMTTCHCEYCQADLMLENPVQPTPIQLEKAPQSQPLSAPMQNMPPEQEFLKWKKAFRLCAIFYAVGIAFLFLDIDLNEGRNSFMDFIAVVLGFNSVIMSLAVPPIMAFKKPADPHPVKNMFKFYGIYLAVFLVCVLLFVILPALS